MTQRSDLLSSTAAHRVDAAHRWMELFMLQPIRNNDWNTGAALRWLLRNPHPQTYSVRMGDKGTVTIECQQGLVGHMLRIGGFDHSLLSDIQPTK